MGKKTKCLQSSQSPNSCVTATLSLSLSIFLAPTKSEIKENKEKKTELKLGHPSHWNC